MALLGSTVVREVGLRLLLCPLGSNSIVTRAACCSVGLVLPVYSTFKAIEKKDQNEEQRWLLYWAGRKIWYNAVLLQISLLSSLMEFYITSELYDATKAYGSFSLVEVFVDKLISWSPLYYYLKFAFLVWLQFPSSGGARHLYLCYLRPFFLRHQTRVDLVVDSVYGEMVKLITAYQAEIQAARAIFTNIMASADQILRGEVTSVRPQSPKGREE